MRTLYLECHMGAAGDMLMAALLELHPDPNGFLERLNALGIPGVAVRAEPSEKRGIRGTRIRVTVHGEEEEPGDDGHGEHHDGEHRHDGHCHGQGHGHEGKDHREGHGGHAHATLHDIEGTIDGLALPERVRDDARAVYRLIAEAEGEAHGRPADRIHFHEVGTLDAVADIVGVCMLMGELGAGRVLASPVHVGCGQVRCAHGILPVPAPATAHILRGVPIYGGSIRGELCTPTGAALLKHFAAAFGDMPVMTVEKIGYGMGKKDFDAANCVRALMGKTEEAGRDRVVELRCNLDDMTPEAIGFAQETLLERGALDVFTTPIGMKKNRPGVLLSCLCTIERRDEVAKLIFEHTTTLGLRENVCERRTLERTERTVETKYGAVRLKESAGWGVTRRKAAYEDVARIAREREIPFSDAASRVMEEIDGK